MREMTGMLISFDMFLLEPKVYRTLPFYLHKVGVRLRTPYPPQDPTCGLHRICCCCCVVTAFAYFGMLLLEPRVYGKQSLYVQKVGVRLRTPHPPQTLL